MQKNIRSPSELGQIVRVSRLSQGLRAEDLTSEVSRGFITHLERGKPTLQIGKVLKVLDELGIRVHLELPPGVELPSDLAEISRKRVKRRWACPAH
ncbi:MAG: transcriptional regulator [Pseudomonadota bacterium]